MPEIDELRTKIGLDGEREYKDGLASIGSGLRTVSSEMAKTTAAFDKNDKSVQALTARNEGLNQKLELQQKKVELCRKVLANAVEAFGEADKRTMQWQRDLNYAEAAVTSTEKAIRQNAAAIEDMNQAASKQSIQNFATGVERAGERLNSAGDKLTMGLTKPLVEAGVASIKSARDTAESLGKVEAAFGFAAEGVKSWSGSTLTAYGLAQGTALDMAALFGDMATSMGFSSAQAADMSTVLVALAVDLASFKNISIDQAATALKSVFTGETESLKNLGVVMTEANLKSYAMSQGMKTAYAEMDQAQKVALRYQFVLDASKNAQGDFARTSDSTANQLRIFTESLKEAAATVGADLLPVITPIITKLSELIQSFGNLDEGTRKTVVQTGLFLAALGPMLKLTGGVATAVNLGVTAYRALTGATSAAAVAQTGLNAAQAASPIGAVVTAVGGLIAGLLSVSVTTELTTEKTENLLDSLERSRTEMQENVAQIDAEKGSTLAMIDVLDELVTKEDKTASQKQAILGIVDKLNKAIPNLSLTYNELTGKLNQEKDAMVAMAEAEAARLIQQEKYNALVETFRIEAETKERLRIATEELAQSQQQWDQVVLNGNEEQELAYGTLNQTVEGHRQKVNELTQTQAENQAEMERLKSEIGDFDDAAAGASSTAANLSDILSGTGESAKAAAERLGEMTQSTKDLVADTKLLSDAFAEQAQNGDLSVDTILKLIDSGYAAAISIDAETGAARLNAEAYMTLATAKLDEQIAGAKQELRAANVSAMEAERAAAIAAASGYVDLAISRAADAAVAKDEANVISANILALQKLKEGIGKVTTGNWSSAPAGRGGSGGKTEKTAEEKAVEAFKDVVEELDYLRDLEQISERDYYNRLMAARDQYLKVGTDAWRDATVKLKNQQEAAYDEEVSDLKYFLDMGIITEQEYFQRLSGLRDQYLEVDTDAWRKANTELMGYLERCKQQQLDTMKKAYDAQVQALEGALEREKQILADRLSADKQAAKDAYEAKREAIENQLALEKERLDTIVQGIDAEIEARRRLREDESQDDAVASAKKRLEAAKAQLSFARTDEDRAQWEKEVVRLQSALDDAVQAKEDTQFYRDKEQEKESVQEQITAAEEAAEAAKQAAQAEYDAQLAQLESSYLAAVERLERDYAERMAQAGSEYREEERRIAAQFESVGQVLNGKGPEPPAAQGAAQAASASAAVSAATQAAQAANAYSQTTSNVTKSANATVNIYQASSLTQGQITGAVKKVLDMLNR